MKVHNQPFVTETINCIIIKGIIFSDLKMHDIINVFKNMRAPRFDLEEFQFNVKKAYYI